jgi:predicted Zn-dependent peptidase
MNQVLGGGPLGRLFRNLREEKGYTYSAQSTLSTSKFPGLLYATVDVRTAMAGAAMKELLDEIGRMREDLVPPLELEDAKRALVGSYATSLDQPAVLLSIAVSQSFYGLPADYWDTFPQRVARVTAEEVRRAAQKYLSASGLQIIAVGDAAKLRDALARFGAVEVIEADGRRAQ